MSPRVAGLPGALVVLLEFRMAPGPLPEELAVKMPGCVVATFTVMPLEDWPRNLTSTVTLVNSLTS